MSGFFTTKHEDYPDHPQLKGIETFKGKVPSVSFSGMSTYEGCAHAIYLNKIKKIPGLGSPATDRGSMLHDMLENYVLGNIDKVHYSKMKAKDFHAPIIEEFRKLYLQGLAHPELQVCFTEDLQPTTWDADDMWFRGAIDMITFSEDGTHAVIYDYKSGSNQAAAKHRSQLMLYACCIFMLYPDVQTIQCTAIYLDHKVDNFYTDYARADLAQFWDRFHYRLKRVTDATEFPPNPNGYSCRWCSHKVVQLELGQTEPACAFGHKG